MLNRTAQVFLLAVCALFGGVSGAGEPGKAGASPSGTLWVTRVFYLEGMEPRDAMTLVRSIQVRKGGILSSHSAIVVSDGADRVSQAEALLRERNVVVRAAEPHAPLYLEQLEKSPAGTRIFRVERDSMGGMVETLLRAIYDVREVNKSEEGSTISASAAPPILDAAEALFRELRMLDESAGGTEGR